MSIISFFRNIFCKEEESQEERERKQRLDDYRKEYQKMLDEQSTPAKEPVKEVQEIQAQAKEEKKRRCFVFKVEAKDGFIIYEGGNLAFTISKNPGKFDFTYKEVYDFCRGKNYEKRLFKGKYIVSRKEIL